MALNFPDNPSLNDTYVDSTSGFTYTWNGTVWISVVDRKIGNIKKIDDISSSFDGLETVFTLTSNGQVITPLETNKTIISVGGVLQNPGDDYSVFGSQITFSTPPASGLTFFGEVLQTDRQKSTLPDGTVGPEDLTTGGFSWNSSGDFIVTGILTSGTSSITIDGSANQITVGSGATINESGISVVGIVTAGSFVGDGSNLTGIVAGLGSTGSANTSGVITATSFTGDGRNLTDVGGYLAGLIYSPGIGQTEVATSTGIAITFTKSITKNSGIINLRENSIGGTIAESFDIATVGSSSTIAISGAKLTITPDTTLGAGTTYFVEVPANTVRDLYDTGGNIGITSFTFETAAGGGGPYEVFVFGFMNQGQLGLNDAVNRSSPTQLPGTQWSDFNAGSNVTILLKSDMTIWQFGSNNRGQLGLNDTVNRSSPTQIPGTTWNKVSTNTQTTSATKTDGTLWVWGYNDNGQLGLNDAVTVHRSSPTQVPGTQWSFVKISTSDSVLATKLDGTLWTWGQNNDGELGLNNIIDYSSPVQIPGTQWSTEKNKFDSAREDNAFATKTDGTLWGWGNNYNGQLGLNDTPERSSPTQIPGTQWNSIVGGRVTIATKTDGTSWVWSSNTYGGLGQNDTVSRSSPTQIPGTQWEYAEHNSYYALAIKTDKTLWSWGGASFALPTIWNNSDLDYSSPTQIPGTGWENISLGHNHGIIFKTI
jgi:hypothetical protein